MPPIDFPGSAGSPFSASNGFTYVWNGNGWISQEQSTTAGMVETAWSLEDHGVAFNDIANSRAFTNIYTIGTTLYAFKLGGVIATTDGHNWTQQSPIDQTPPTGTGTNSNAQYMSYDRFRNHFIRVYAGTPSAAYRSTDFGATWDAPDSSVGAIPGDGLFFAEASPVTGTVIATRKSGNNRIYRSTDNWATWTDLGNFGNTTSKRKVFCTAAGTFIVNVNANNHLRSTDDGLTWNTMTGAAWSSSDSYAAQSHLHEDGTGQLVIVDASTLVTIMYTSSDDGASWSAVGTNLSGVSTAQEPQNLVYTNSRWYLTTRGAADSRDCRLFEGTDLNNWTYVVGLGTTHKFENVITALNDNVFVGSARTLANNTQSLHTVTIS